MIINQDSLYGIATGGLTSYIQFMVDFPYQARNGPSARAFFLIKVAGLLTAGGLIYGLSGSSVVLALVGGSIVVFTAFWFFRNISKLFDRYPVIEVYQHCIIDLMFFKERVLWEDVEEIVLFQEGISVS